MTFAFTSTIPAANNDPADDQPLMLQNNASTAALIAIDHVGFNVANGGMHKQVTFTANQSAPGFSTGVSDLFVNLVSSVSQLFFQNSAGTVQLTGLTVTQSGSNYGITTPWGLIFNFGSAGITPAGTAVVFAVPFSTATYAALTGQDQNNGTAKVQGLSLTGFTYVYSNAGGATGWYLVIGK